MNRRIRTTRPCRRGVALLLVLGIIMAITLLSLGFIARCDVELASGRSLAVRVQMDQMAVSALEHARGLLLNPQDAGGAYWTGDTSIQLDPNTNDFYDVTVTADPSDECVFDVTCEAYRLRQAEQVGNSSFAAVVRLDPAIGLWCGSDLSYRAAWSVVGDAYAAGTFTNLGVAGAVDGDLFAGGLSGGIVGTYKDAGTLAMTWPPVTAGYSHPDYVISSIGPGTVSGGSYSSPKIWRCSGNLTLDGALVINGMLLVEGDLVIKGVGARLTAAKNLPAAYVTGNLFLHGATDLQIEGLVAVDGSVLVGHGSDAEIVGGLFANGEIAEAAIDSTWIPNDAILRNIPTWPPRAFWTLDGVSQYMQTLDDADSLQVTGDYTLSVLLAPAVTQNPWAAIVCKTDPAGSINHWVLQFDSTATELIVGHDSVRWSTGILRTELTDGIWHHVVVVRQGTTMKSYLDWTERATGTFSNMPGSGDGHLNIGADRTGSASYVYKGLLDEVRVYKRALLASEIFALPSDSLIGHWTFAGSGSALNVVASPTKAAITTWASGSRVDWSPAGGAFFKSIHRVE